MASFEIQPHNDTPLLNKVFNLIVAERRGYANFNPKEFFALIKSNAEEICETFNTRWLISICDTFARCDDKELSSKAMIIVTMVNMIKLWGTDLKIREEQTIEKKINTFRKTNEEIWDGVITLRLSREGDMFINMIKNQKNTLKNEPLLYKIYETILKKCLSDKNCPLCNLINKTKQ